MDTKAVAEELGISPKTLRAFLRSPQSTFSAVGSGARYEFDAEDLPMLRDRFREWSRTKGRTAKPKDVAPRKAEAKPTPTRSDRIRRTIDRDRAVWAKEAEERGGKPIVLEDIRDPRVRARVQRDAKAAEMRLENLLLAAGLHITQQWGGR